jgi:hypothetical protein
MTAQAEKQFVYKDSNKMRKSGLLFLVLSPIFFLVFRKETFSALGPWEFPLIRLASWAFVVIALWMILFSADLTVIADKSTRTLQLRYGTLLRSTRSIPFDDIADIQVQKGVYTSSASKTSYRLVVVLKDGTLVPFRSYFTKDNYQYKGDAKNNKVAGDLREFITGTRHSDVPKVERAGVSLEI